MNRYDDRDFDDMVERVAQLENESSVYKQLFEFLFSNPHKDITLETFNAAMSDNVDIPDGYWGVV